MADNGYAAEMHISDPSVGFAGADGMIGPGHVIATGSAFDFRARGSDQVSVVFGGDGTYATPHFHSALNNAALLKRRSSTCWRTISIISTPIIPIRAR